MELPGDTASKMRFGPVGRALIAASKAGAMIGGTIFVALVAMSIVSITGRKLFSMPVPGDVELLQLFAAIASSTFFAWCHLVGGDVKVDFFTQRLRPSAVQLLDAFGSLLIGLLRCADRVADRDGRADGQGLGRGDDDPRPAAVVGRRR